MHVMFPIEPSINWFCKTFFVGGGRWGGKVVCRLCCVYPVALSWKVGILKVIYLLLTETGHDPSYRFNRNSHDPGLLFCVILYVCIMTMYYVPKMCSVAVWLIVHLSNISFTDASVRHKNCLPLIFSLLVETSISFFLYLVTYNE